MTAFETMLTRYRRYLPLRGRMRGRRRGARSRAVEFPNGMDGNLFYRPDGGYVLPFFRTEPLIFPQGFCCCPRRKRNWLPAMENSA